MPQLFISSLTQDREPSEPRITGFTDEDLAKLQTS